MRVGFLLGAVALAVIGTVMPAQSDAGPQAPLGVESEVTPTRATTTPVRVVEARQTTGQPATVTLRIARPDRARTVRVESRTTGTDGAPSWQTLRSRAVHRGTETLTLAPVHTGRAHYRALVDYRGTGWTATTAFSITASS